MCVALAAKFNPSYMISGGGSRKVRVFKRRFAVIVSFDDGFVELDRRFEGPMKKKAMIGSRAGTKPLRKKCYIGDVFSPLVLICSLSNYIVGKKCRDMFRPQQTKFNCDSE